MKDNKTFKPYIPADKVLPEFTVTSVILGILLAVIFGGANAYLGLRVGMTVSASIPAAVISMGIIRIILKKDSILENNMVQTIGSAGESLAAGAIFTLPALFMWAADDSSVANPSFLVIAFIGMCGGLLGTLFMVPLRTALIVEEHGVLPFPEGTACAEVLLAGEEGGDKSKLVFTGLGVAAFYKFIADGLCLFPSEVDWSISAYPGSGIGMDVLPALVGVGYICGARISSYMLGGAMLGWFVMMPAMVLLGGDNIMFPADAPFNTLDTWTLWGSFVRYIGAGAVACGGILSLVKSLPLIVKTFAKAIKGFGHAGGNERTARDLPMPIVLGGVAVLAILLWLIPTIPISLLAAVIIVVFGFFFATVSARMVGLVGSSNNPVSGMAIATLLISTVLLKVTGNTGIGGMTTAICIGTVICIVAAMAGDTSQDLKTGYIVGATPVMQQIGELIGSVASGLAIGGVLYLLNAAWGFGTSQLPAPQASLMKMVVEGVMNGNLPWGLVFLGVFIALAVEIVGIPVLPFAIGLYLPIHLSTPIMVGGLVRLWIEKRKFKTEADRNAVISDGVLYASGMIAGEGLVGILLAVFAVFGLNLDMGAPLGNWGGVAFFAVLVAIMIYFMFAGKKNAK
ncbi:MAG: oligopeptide transporter, OPT family [Oscillospiraceae bacterium]|nr:oligopeptide transporter, OPT family [Oscillospiraceae bacterium]